MKLRVLLMVLAIMLLSSLTAFAVEVDMGFRNISGIGYYDLKTNPDYSKLTANDILMYSKAAELRYNNKEIADKIIIDGIKYVKSVRDILRIAYFSNRYDKTDILKNILRPDVVCDLKVKQAIHLLEELWPENDDIHVWNRNKAAVFIAKRINNLSELHMFLSFVNEKWRSEIRKEIERLEANSSNNSEDFSLSNSET